jgi:predicted cupin superfamily sugar epimerase
MGAHNGAMTATATLTIEQIKQLLGLLPHPTCGFTHETYRSPHRLPMNLGDGRIEPRALGSVLYFLVTPDRRMALHRIRSEQMYHHYLGDPLEVVLLYEDGQGEMITVGRDLTAGMRPQLLIPANTWHISRLSRGGRYALLGTTEWPSVDPSDVERGEPEALARQFPGVASLLRDFAR